MRHTGPRFFCIPAAVGPIRHKIVAMSENDILYGLLKVKEQNSNATIGVALEQLMGLDGFHFDNLGGNIVTVNISENCKFNKDDVAGVIGLVSSMVREGKLLLEEIDEDFGTYTEHELLRLSTPGSLEHVLGADNETWTLLSSKYSINN